MPLLLRLSASCVAQLGLIGEPARLFAKRAARAPLFARECSLVTGKQSMARATFVLARRAATPPAQVGHPHGAPAGQAEPEHDSWSALIAAIGALIRQSHSSLQQRGSAQGRMSLMRRPQHGSHVGKHVRMCTGQLEAKRSASFPCYLAGARVGSMSLLPRARA